MMNPADKINILLVDDRPGALVALESALADLDQNLIKASSGREALKYVLKMEFAVILLDVHMPGMDGFETARLIRQRKSSQHTPIIFITGHTDELHIAKGYSLGAVDYILAPVLPDVLRAKVGVFVDLYQKTAQIRHQADWLRRRAGQLQKLAAASIAINAAQFADQMLQTITDAARDVVGAHQSITLFLGEQDVGPGKPLAVSSFSHKYAAWQGRHLDLAPVTQTLVARSGAAVRLTEEELHQHPDWEIVSKLDIPPMHGGMLAAPFTGHDGRNLGVIYLADAYDGQFTNEDEAILVQLAQIASIAIENILYAEAREANRLKDEFLATLSHELRTPLNAMLGWTRLLRNEEQPEPEMIAHGLQVIERNVNAQARLIEDLLDISRITSGKLRLDMGPMSLKSVVEAALDAVKPAADARRIRVEAVLPDDPMELVGDANRLQQVMWNLLTNAIKFTPEGGTIQVEMAAREQMGHIQIRDTGEGIPPELLPHVFERFRQADSTSTRSHGGLGVGLAIVRHIVQMHDGWVDADSAGPGEGSTFCVRLPLRPATAEAWTDEAGGGAAADEAQRQGSLTDVRVLVVDDERDARELLGQIIRRHGGCAELVSSARQALDVLGQRMPDILLSDIAMPECDGYTLIRRVRDLGEPQFRELPAIALTAHAGERDQARSLAAGFQMHLAKPVEPDELVAAIARLAVRDRSPVANPLALPLE